MCGSDIRALDGFAGLLPSHHGDSLIVDRYRHYLGSSVRERHRSTEISLILDSAVVAEPDQEPSQPIESLLNSRSDNDLSRSTSYSTHGGKVAGDRLP